MPFSLSPLHRRTNFNFGRCQPTRSKIKIYSRFIARNLAAHFLTTSLNTFVFGADMSLSAKQQAYIPHSNSLAMLPLILVWPYANPPKFMTKWIYILRWPIYIRDGCESNNVSSIGAHRLERMTWNGFTTGVKRAHLISRGKFRIFA